MNGATALLQVVAVGKLFGRLRALHDVSFEVKFGEIVGIIGPNGAGKSTLVDVVAARTHPTSGRVRFDGREFGNLPAYRVARCGIARTFQVARSFPGASALDVVMIGALNGRHAIHPNLASARDEALRALSRLGLAARVLEDSERLDIAGRKRLQIAQALAMNPRLLILDEVMAGLPPREIDAIARTIGEIRRDGVTIVVIEHVMRAIEALADRIVVLHHGEKIADERPEAVFRDPVVMRAYLGSRFRS